MPSYKQKKQRLRELVKQEQQQRIKKVQQQGHQFVDSDQFKRLQKHYKYYKHRETDYSELLKIEDLKKQSIDGYDVYVLEQPRGAFLIKGFISLKEQYMVGFQALNEYIFRPYRTNLDGTNGLYHQNANQNNNETLNKQSQKQQKIEENSQQKKEEASDSKNEQKGKLINIKLQNQKILQNVDPSNKQARYHLNQKIRMSNLGYQYDWPHRSYPTTRVSIPKTIRELTKKAANLYQQISKQKISYHGQAVIVNYYKKKDYMTGHLDDGEEDQINPIFSFCFGLSCVFLLGYPTRQKKPHAIRLDAGDLLSNFLLISTVMSSFSRICYHGVPRIIQDSYSIEKILSTEKIKQQAEQIKIQIDKIIQEKKESLKNTQNIEKRYLNRFQHVKSYFMEHRLNINVRQVWVRKGKQTGSRQECSESDRQEQLDRQQQLDRQEQQDRQEQLQKNS